MYSLILVAAMSSPAPIAEVRRPFLSRLFGRRTAKGAGCSGVSAQSSGCNGTQTAQTQVTMTATTKFTAAPQVAKVATKVTAMPATASPEAVGASGPARRVLLRFGVHRAIAAKERSGELSARDADKMRAVMRDPDLRGAVLTNLSIRTAGVQAGERPFLEFLMLNWKSIADYIIALLGK